LVVPASATTDPPAVYDGRSVAMGGTGVAHIHNAAALYHNVASLHEVEQLTVTADISPTTTTLTAPVNGPGTSSDSVSSIVPLFLVGGAYRINDRIVIGLAAYATGGFGTKYELAGPGISKLQLGAFEISPGIAVALTKELSLGVGYRASYMMQQADAKMPAPPPAPAGTLLDSKLDLSGTNFLGFDAGVYYRPIKPLRVGLSYRSKVTTDLSGTTKVAGQSIDTTSEFSFPHAFKIGGAYEIIDDTLLVAADVKYLLHAEANKETVIKTPVGNTTQVLDWKDSISAGLGVEYVVNALIPVRAGYRLTTSATPKDRPGPFFTPPGVLHSVHAGVGLKLQHIDVDVGGLYAWGKEDATAPKPPALPGTYSMKTIMGAASVTYHQ
jgi:long-chain fatty acid transport protein